MSAQIIPLPEREHAFREPCEDVLACGAIQHVTVQPGSVLVFCTRCGRARVSDGRLDELDAAIEAQETLS